MKDKKSRGAVLIVIGALCVAASLALFLYNMWDDARAGIQVTEEKEIVIAAVLPETSVLPPYHAAEPAVPLLEDVEVPGAEPYREMTVKEINGVKYTAILGIPDLNLELPIRSEWSYDALNDSPCRYTGSAWMNDLVICAHNYSQHFGRLKDLETDSEVLLVDMDGNLFRYRVVQIETLLPSDIGKLLDSEYDLSLFTCTLGGRARVTVRCERVSD